MQFLSTLLLAAAVPLALAAPTANTGEIEKRFSESTPWTISNFKYYKPNPASYATVNESISFNFCDQNAGIQLDTTCSVSQLMSAGSLIGTSYTSCANSTVEFFFTGTTLNVSRSYIDPSVGPCPLYCDVETFGGAALTLTRVPHPHGVTLKETRVEVPITAEIA